MISIPSLLSAEETPIFIETIYNASTQAIIFDCDGVLIDSEPLKFLAWQRAFACYEISFDIEEYLPTIGHSSKNILKMIEGAKELKIPETVIGIKNSYYKELNAKGIPSIEQVVTFVMKLAQQKQALHIKLAVASSAPRQEVLHNLKEIGLDACFDVVVSGSDDLADYIDTEGKNKPKPYVYLETAKRLHVEPVNCVVFEDTEAGVIAASDAKMKVIALPNRMTAQQDFSKASVVLNDYGRLDKFFPLFFNR